MAILKVDTISGIGTEGPVFEGDIEFTSQNFLTLPKGDTIQRGRGRGLIVANYIQPSNYNTSEFITIQSTGNSIDFGDTSAAVRGHATFASSTRAVFAGGLAPGPSVVDIIESMEILSTGNAVDFGTLLETVNTFGGCSNGHGGL